METTLNFIETECEAHVKFDNPSKVAFKWFRCWHSIEKVENVFHLRTWLSKDNESAPNDFFTGHYHKKESEAGCIYEILHMKCFLNKVAVDEKWWKYVADNGYEKMLFFFADTTAKKYSK